MKNNNIILLILALSFITFCIVDVCSCYNASIFNTPPDLQIFVIFHKNIYTDFYDLIPDKDLHKYFTFIAVNENIEKKYPTDAKFKIVKEWELPMYNKELQKRGYRECGVIDHIYVNDLHKPYDYIGFLQYDMKLNENIVDVINKNKNENVYFTVENHDFDFFMNGLTDKQTMELVMDDYEKFFNKSFSRSGDYPLLNTFVISVERFDKGMKWIHRIYMWIIDKLGSDNMYACGYFERIMGLFIGEENMKYIKLNIQHDNNFRV